MSLARAHAIGWNEIEREMSRNGKAPSTGAFAPQAPPPFQRTYEGAFPQSISTGAFAPQALPPTSGQGAFSSFLQSTTPISTYHQAYIPPLDETPIAPDGSEWIGRLQFTVSEKVLIYDSLTEGEYISRDKMVPNRRLIVIVTAFKENGEVYWKQAFYRSSGKNSQLPALWFPFYGMAVKVRMQQNGTKQGSFYLSKGFGFISALSKDEYIFRKEGRLYSQNEIGWQLSDRLNYRSFLLASGMIGMQGGKKDSRQMVVDLLKEYIKPKYVDTEIYRRILETNHSPDIYDKYYELNNDKTYKYPNNTEEEVNEFIGTNLIVNFGRAPEDQLSIQNISVINIGEGRGKFPYVQSGKDGYYLGLNKKRENIVAGLTPIRVNKFIGGNYKSRRAKINHKQKALKKQKTRKANRKH